MAIKKEEQESKMLMGIFNTFIKQAPEQRKHELTILIIKVGFLVAILLGSTWLTIEGKFSQDLTVALYVAAFGYVLGTIK